MRMERRFTKEGRNAYAEIEFRKATSEIKNPDGSIVFRAADIDVPAQFSQVAADILAQKYFRKAGVPARDLIGRDIRPQGRIAHHAEIHEDRLQPACRNQIAHEVELCALGIQGAHKHDWL